MVLLFFFFFLLLFFICISCFSRTPKLSKEICRYNIFATVKDPINHPLKLNYTQLLIDG